MVTNADKKIVYIYTNIEDLHIIFFFFIIMWFFSNNIRIILN